MPTMVAQTLESLIAGFFLWLGLFLLSRGIQLPPQRRQLATLIRGPIAPAGAGLLLTALYQFSVAMRTAVTDPALYTYLFRAAWWTIPIATGLWLRAVLVLSAPGRLSGDRAGASRGHNAIIPTMVIGVTFTVLAIVGTGSQTIFAFEQIKLPNAGVDPFYIPPTLPGYLLYSSVLLLALWGAAAILWRQHNLFMTAASRRAARLLPLGNAIFAAGVTARLAGYWLAPGQLPEQSAGWIMVVGLAVLGHGMVHTDAFLKGETVRHDYRRSLQGAGLAVMPGLLLTILVFGAAKQPVPAVLLPLLVLLLTLLATPLRVYTWLVNAWTLPAWQTRFMQQLVDVHYVVLTAANQEEALLLVQGKLVGIAQEARHGLQREIISGEVNHIFRHKNLQNDQVLGNSKLLGLGSVRQAVVTFAARNQLRFDALSEAERARVLRKFLVEFIEQQLSPVPGERPPRPASDQWLAYLILTKSYLEGKTRREVVLEIQRETGARLSGLRETGGRAYAGYLRQGRERLAELLWRCDIQQ